MEHLDHFKGLRCLEAAARHKSYTQAAEELHITQAAVSQQLRLLEAHLGIKLFIRRGRSMQPTSRAQQLADTLTAAFGSIGSCWQEIQCQGVPGELNITTTQSFASLILLPNLGQFNRLHPEIKVRVWASSQLEDLQHAEMDIGIRFGDIDAGELCCRHLFDDDTVPLCSSQLAQEQALTQASQLSQCWLIDADDKPGQDWLAWFAAAGITPDTQALNWVRVANLDMALSTALSGHGVFLGSRLMAQQYICAGTLTAPLPQVLPGGIRYHLLYHAASPKLARIRRFEDWLQALIASLKAQVSA